MKIGRTTNEKRAANKILPDDKIIFALRPRMCDNTNRWVWLEYVKYHYYYSYVYGKARKYIYEIGYDFTGDKE